MINQLRSLLTAILIVYYLKISLSSKISNQFNLPHVFLSSYVKNTTYELSHFENILFIDSDILGIRDFSKIWDYLEDVILLDPAYNPIIVDINYGVYEAGYTEYLMIVANNFTQYNSGSITIC